MRVRLLTVPFALAIVAACVGSEHFTGPGSVPGIGGQAGDSGTVTDAAVADDAGPTSSCNTQILPVGPVFANDNCVLVGGTTPANATITSAGCSNVRIDLTDGFNCVGSVTGSTNAFIGNCGGPNPCTSNSLPGTLNCTIQLSAARCTIQVCANATGSICP
jgi:hypothetical protein